VRGIGLVIALVGCGRIAFDPLGERMPTGDGGSDDTASDDGNNVVVPGPIAWWELDENMGTMAMDSIGTAHGTLLAGATALPVWTNPAKIGSGLAFAGDGDGVLLPTDAALSNVPMLSITAWVRPATVAVGPNQCIFDKASPGGGYYLTISGLVDGSIDFTVPAGGPNECSRASFGNYITANAWNHVAATWTGSTVDNNGIRLYVNGAEVAYAQTSIGGSRQNDAAIAPSINCRAGNGMVGTLDDVRFYNVVLTPEQVAAVAAR
jgi:hypothetical protein